uniref:Uncharacterized protein n=1 Tax=Hucho hucho TaxID=62062 RepID=A0A4W5NS73_9TELE
ISVENTPCLSVSLSAMTAKRAALITDSYKSVKRSRREEKRASSPAQKDRWNIAIEYEIELLRLQRWERAAQHGLNPPQEIRDMLFSNPLWKGF